MPQAIKRLSAPSGEIMPPVDLGPSVPMMAPIPGVLTRPALVVHAGPFGQEAKFQTADGDWLKFDRARVQAIVDRYNEDVALLAAGYGGVEKIPIGAFPPILDHHNGESNDSIRGRLGPVARYEERSVPKVGDQVPCCIIDLTFLGDESCQKVQDGRIFHLSVGVADDPESESYNRISEVSTVIEPAAAGAMLLSKGRQKQKGASMNKKKLAALSAELKKMSSSAGAIKAKLVKTSEASKLAAAVSSVTKRLSKYVEEGRITPADLRSMDIKKLASLPADVRELSLGTIAKLEPRVIPGQAGTTEAVTFSSIASDMGSDDREKLRAEIRGDFKRLGAKMKGDSKAVAGGKKDVKKMSAADETVTEKKETTVEKKASDDKPEEVKIPDVTDQGGLNEMQAQIDELSTNLARVVSMVNELASDEEEQEEQIEEIAEAKAEGDGDAELEGEKDETAELEGEKDEEKKDLSGAEDKKDEKSDDSDSNEKEKSADKKD